MAYQIIAPPPSLANYVSYFWTLEHQTDNLSPRTYTVMCSGTPGLVFQQDPSVFAGFDGERLPQLFAFGQATKYGQLRSCGSFHSVGVSFRPTALKAVFGLDASHLTDQNACISLLAKTSLADELSNCRTAQQQVSRLSAFLLAQVQQHGEENKKIVYAAAALQRGIRLPDVLQAIQLSERQLQRLFLTHIGIRPVLYARICRFQTALGLLREGKFRSLTDAAHSLGYFDQSHFIRDFKLFAGASPRVYLRKTVEQMPGFPEWEE